MFGNAPEIPLKEVEDKIARLDDGGETFKKLFVIHALSSFLTPTRKRTVDMRLAKVVACVDDIKNYNWAEYVFDRFCESHAAYIESGGLNGIVNAWPFWRLPTSTV